MVDPTFWRGRRVLVTGHTGFKGAWLTLWLDELGAIVTGLALPPPAGESLYRSLGDWRKVTSHFGDIRDQALVQRVASEAEPEIVIHLAAQAIVRRAFLEPIETFATNVMGTAHLLDAVVPLSSVKAVLIVTSDKVYNNRETGRRFGEDDPLGGDDPYSASKVAAEQVGRSYRRRPTGHTQLAIGVARAGNVMGGGDWGEDRLIPDLIRAGITGQVLRLRNPDATRPWHFVLDALSGYLAYAQALAVSGPMAPPALNFGPRTNERSWSTEAVVAEVQASLGWDSAWIASRADAVPEKRRLALDCSLAEKVLGWRPQLDTTTAIDWLAQWYRAAIAGEDMRRISVDQITRFADLEDAAVVR